ncbi:hypothetical protein FKM82_029488 [Ascaphus truei]
MTNCFTMWLAKLISGCSHFQSTSSLESNLEGLAGVLEADLPNYKSKILRLLCTVARLLPEKMTVYTTLVGLLNARNYNFGGEFVEAMIRHLKETIKANAYNDAVYLVIAFSRCLNFFQYQTMLFNRTVQAAVPEDSETIKKSPV